MSKYEPLSTFLDAQPEDMLTLTFDSVAEIIGAPLPKSAYMHAAWWANNPTGHSHCRAWIEAGWQTVNINLADKRVNFVRIKSGTADQPASPFGALAGTVTVHDMVALTNPASSDWELVD